MSYADGAQTMVRCNSQDFGGNGETAGDKDGKVKVEASREPWLVLSLSHV